MDSEEFLLVSTESALNWSAAVYNYKTANLLKTYKNGGVVAAKTLNVISDDYILAAEQSKPLLHVWQLNSQEVAKNMRLVLPEPANCVAICPKNVYIAIGISTKLYIWTLNGKLLSVQKKHFQPITCVVFSSDSQYLAVSGQDGILLIYKVADLVAFQSNYLSQKSLGQVEPLHTINHNSMPITELYTGKFGKKSRLVSVSSDQSCRIYNFITGQLFVTLVLNEPLTSVVFDLPCWQLFIGCHSGVIKQYNLKNPPRTLTQHVDENNSKEFIGHKKKVICLSINATNNILASGSDDKFVYLWEIKSRQILKKLEYTGPVSNLKFVLGYSNFMVDNFKPKLALKSFERSLDTENNTYICSINQTEDIELNDDENDFVKEKQRSDLAVENRRLRTINKQLFNVAVQISKKYNCE